MSTEAQIAQARRARKHRSVMYSVLLGLVILSILYAALVTPRWSPQGLLITSAAVSFLVLGNLYVEKADSWQRERALAAFALGGVAGIVVAAAQGALVAMDADHRSDPQWVVRAFVGVWLVSDVVLRQWPNMRGQDE